MALDQRLLGPVKKIYVYQPEQPPCSVTSFLNSVSDETAASYMKQFEKHCAGHTLRGDRWHPLEESLFEYKDNASKSRIIHTTYPGHIQVLLYAFNGKKEDKIAEHHMIAARKLLQEFERRVDKLKKRRGKT